MQKTAVITGASHGIGKAVADRFAAEGYNLYLTCRSSIDSLTLEAQRLSETYGIQVKALCVDASSYEETAALFAALDQVDVLINNAGISHIGLLQDMTPDQWDKVINTNLSSCFYTCKCAIPIMLKQGCGKILNVSSVWGNVGASTEVAYSASKGGMNAFTKALAKELAPSNIQVNAIACGLIDTRMNSELTAEDMECLTEEIPAGRAATPAEVADMILRTVNAPSYLTGQIITFDGAWI